MRFPILAITVVVMMLAGTTNLAAAADCARTSTGLHPLPDLGMGTYEGVQGGLYPGGANTPPAAYTTEGRRAAAEIMPRSASGQADASGKVVLLSIGMSNTTQEFSAFVRVAQADPLRDSHVIVVDGAQGGQDARDWSDPKHATWTRVDARLAKAGVTTAQVQAVWLKQAIARPVGDFAATSAKLETALAQIVDNAKVRYPNLVQVFLSPRTYAGYAVTELNPEPYAYESGFAVKRLVERSVRGPGARPWLSWGPYLWADGTKARADGLTWACADTQSDGVHPSPSGEAKVAQQLQAFFSGSEFTTWYRGESSAPVVPAVTGAAPTTVPPTGGSPLPALVLAAAAVAIGGAATITLRLASRLRAAPRRRA